MTEMPMSAALGADEGVRIGNIFGRSFAVLSRHFLSFSILAGIPAAPPVLFAAFLTPAFLAPGAATHLQAGAVLAGAVSLIAGIFLWLVLAMIAQAMILYGAFQDMRGRPVLIVESAKKGLARLLPVIGVSICIGFTIAFGGLLLVVPAFVFLSMYYVALPACVVERLGPMASMSRSAALTKGHRWKVFGLYLVVALLGAIASLLIPKMFGMFGGTVVAVVTVLWAAFFGAYRAITVAVLYHDLRAAREGIDVEQMVAVFD